MREELKNQMVMYIHKSIMRVGVNLVIEAGDLLKLLEAEMEEKKSLAEPAAPVDAPVDPVNVATK